jgi:hypothetical protein
MHSGMSVRFRRAADAGPSTVHWIGNMGLNVARRLALLIGAVALLTSCGGEPRLALPEAPTATIRAGEAAATPARSTPAAHVPAFDQIIWTTGTDPATNAPVDTVSGYSTDAPSIIAALQASNLPSGASVSAQWSYNDTPLDAFGTSLTAAGSVDERWITFRLDRDPGVPWPPGAYAISVSLNGSPVQEATIDVTEPA